MVYRWFIAGLPLFTGLTWFTNQKKRAMNPGLAYKVRKGTPPFGCHAVLFSTAIGLVLLCGPRAGWGGEKEEAPGLQGVSTYC